MRLAAYLLRRWLPVLVGVLLIAALIYFLKDCAPIAA